LKTENGIRCLAPMVKEGSSRNWFVRRPRALSSKADSLAGSRQRGRGGQPSDLAAPGGCGSVKLRYVTLHMTPASFVAQKHGGVK
jgi:hypothetical protein